jgi:hypothetical protein
MRTLLSTPRSEEKSNPEVVIEVVIEVVVEVRSVYNGCRRNVGLPLWRELFEGLALPA